MLAAPDNGALLWRTSTRSGAAGNCVQVARTSTAVAVRDSKDPEGPILEFAPDAWGEFVGLVRTGGLDPRRPVR